MQTENYYIDCRYIPGSIGSGSSLDNGAVMTTARRTRGQAMKLFESLVSDSRIQWATVRSRRGDKLGSHPK